MPIRNLTPHGVSLYHAPSLAQMQPLSFDRTGGGWLMVVGASYCRWDKADTPARVSELKSDEHTIKVPELVDYEGPGALGTALALRGLPVRSVAYGPISDLPDQIDGTYLIVSLLVVQAAKAAGRTTADLLTPGDLVRDERGEIVGCTCFYRW